MNEHVKALTEWRTQKAIEILWSSGQEYSWPAENRRPVRMKTHDISRVMPATAHQREYRQLSRGNRDYKIFVWKGEHR
jgi:hypothetical protein